MQKYKITPRMLESVGEIKKLERDGFSREEIHRQMYKVTHGASTSERRKMMTKMYDRSE